jgi:hypothetical protein
MEMSQHSGVATCHLSYRLGRQAVSLAPTICAPPVDFPDTCNDHRHQHDDCKAHDGHPSLNGSLAAHRLATIPRDVRGIGGDVQDSRGSVLPVRVRDAKGFLSRPIRSQMP